MNPKQTTCMAAVAADRKASGNAIWQPCRKLANEYATQDGRNL
jgi:hypothetical protein